MSNDNISKKECTTKSTRRRDLIIALSLANLVFLRVWRELLFASEADSYWIPQYGPATYFAALLNVTWVTAVVYGGARLLRKTHNPVLMIIGRLSLLIMLIFPLDFFRKFGVKQSTLNAALDHPLLAGTVGLVALGFAGYLLFVRLKTTTNAVAWVLFAVSPFAAITLSQATYRGLIAFYEQGDAKAKPHTPANNDTVQHLARPRIIWLLFDELDSRIAFSERPANVSLPSFDRFQSECITALDGETHGQSTLRAIPSFLTGKIVTELRFDGSSDLQFRFRGEEHLPFASFSKTPTLFSDVCERGGKNAVVGMYHPYDRILGEQVQYCSAYMMNTYSTKATGSVLTAMIAQLQGITPLATRFNGIKMYQGILRECVELVTSPTYDVVFAHISVPHGPHVYDRNKGAFTLINFSPDAYLDSLVLADQFLQTVRQALEEEEMWDDSLVLITSDHELRQVEFGDRKRVAKTPLLMKMPGQKKAETFFGTFSPKMITRDLLVGVLDGEVTTPEDVLLELNQAKLPVEPLSD